MWRLSRFLIGFLFDLFAMVMAASAQATLRLHKETAMSGDYLLKTAPRSAPATILQQANAAGISDIRGWRFVSQFPAAIPLESTPGIPVWVSSSASVYDRSRMATSAILN